MEEGGLSMGSTDWDYINDRVSLIAILRRRITELQERVKELEDGMRELNRVYFEKQDKNDVL